MSFESFSWMAGLMSSYELTERVLRRMDLRPK